MPLIAVGLSYHTAPVDLREQFALDGEALHQTLQALCSLPSIDEAAILSTCNRLEIYASTPHVEEGWQALESYLLDRSPAPLALRSHLYGYAETSAAEHLMRVACGLDSLILGEPQILGQVSDALTQANQAGTTGAILSHLFSDALHAGKRARAETAISRHTTSTSHAAVLLAAEHIADIRSANALVIGAGDMAALAVKALHAQGVHQIGCINRTYARATALVRSVGGRSFNWYHLSDALQWADVVIAATGAPHTVIHQEELAEVMPNRPGRPLVLVDIALPRDVEEDVDQIEGVHRFDIDDLQDTLDANLARRKAARPAVESIIAEEMENFMHWYRGRRAVPTLVDMRRKVKEIARAELEDALGQLPDLDERQEEIVRRMVHRLVNKVLHEPTVQLKAAAAQSPELGAEYAEAVQALFGLSDAPTAADEHVQPLAEPSFLSLPSPDPFSADRAVYDCSIAAHRNGA